MKSLRFITAAAVAAFLTSLAAYAGDPTGTWKWSVQGRGGNPTEITAKLALKDGKLSGSVTMPGRRGGEPTTTEIGDASFKDDAIAFSVSQTFGQNTRVSKYTGKLEGDAIKGSSERTGRDGQIQKTDWNATRAK